MHGGYPGVKVSNHPTQIESAPQGQRLVIVNPVDAMLCILPSLLYTYKVVYAINHLCGTKIRV